MEDTRRFYVPLNHKRTEREIRHWLDKIEEERSGKGGSILVWDFFMVITLENTEDLYRGRGGE